MNPLPSFLHTLRSKPALAYHSGAMKAPRFGGDQWWGGTVESSRREDRTGRRSVCGKCRPLARSGGCQRRAGMIGPRPIDRGKEQSAPTSPWRRRFYEIMCAYFWVVSRTLCPERFTSETEEHNWSIYHVCTVELLTELSTCLSLAG